MTWGVIVFPGSNDDRDTRRVLADVMGAKVRMLWHKDTDLKGVDAIVLPGGFSYGDYLRAGAIARISPVMEEVSRFANAGGPVLGICNGFQVLCEAGLLPGALIRNNSLQFRCQWVHLRVEGTHSPFTSASTQGQVLRVPISHGEGSYYADAATLAELEDRNGVLLRYCTESGDITEDANPNGSVGNIAGIVNARGNVLGMMPHPERCCEGLLGGEDGRLFFESLLERAAG